MTASARRPAALPGPGRQRRECSTSPLSHTPLTAIAYEDAGENASAAAYWGGHRAAELKCFYTRDELSHDVLKHASSGNSLSPSARLNAQSAAACAAAHRCRLHTTAVASWASIGATQHLFFRVSDDGCTGSRRLTTPAWPAPYPTWRGTSRRRRSPTEWDQMCTVASPPNLGRGAAKFNNFP